MMRTIRKAEHESSPHTPGHLARLACVAEVMAPKAGNVSPGRDFADATWVDFVRSASVCAPILDSAPALGVGRTILDCVQATRRAVATNTNLGIVMLLAPLAALRPRERWRQGVSRVLDGLGPEDARLVYEAICLARPAGLGRVGREDVHDPPTLPLVEAMALAAGQDAVARQYANSFADVARLGDRFTAVAGPLDKVIVCVHLEQMAYEPDSLIRRKCGIEVAAEAQRRAASLLAAGWPDAAESADGFAALDQWLRDDEHKRNPGTSADLVTAALYTALRDGHLREPFDWGESGFFHRQGRWKKPDSA